MKKTSIHIFIVLFISATILGSCREKDRPENNLTVSIDPQKYFLECIVKDKFTVSSIIPPGSNPESFDPTPSQMVSLGKSKLYFKVGYFNFENVWIKNIQDNNPRMSIIDCSTGITSLDEEHSHDCTHHNHGGHSGADPHIWSSPATARIMAQNMYNAIIKVDPDNKEFYKENLDNLFTEFNKTDSIIKSHLDRAKGKSFIIYHPALSYYANEYGLEQYPIEFEGKSPSPVQLKELVDLSKAKDIKIVFVQQEFDVNNAQTIAKEINAKIVTLNLLSYNWNEEMIKIAEALASE
ncbi:hypothetical protein D0T53_08245 [Dysgonomonas sp. 216]|uniref:metal ABC transporter solute-binding protein, Zn/Mn family n=1 Tax=Dysgonomonas sp. 216 TaxID=2302934 RepID=UPI0013CFB805|nr:zinc ABC transporter substrate-binding protein [Dysgonomonas sp. 216]NDW18902.1 hypothetical protein [Dysgonomonas sp. 216]